MSIRVPIIAPSHPHHFFPQFGTSSLDVAKLFNRTAVIALLEADPRVAASLSAKPELDA